MKSFWGYTSKPLLGLLITVFTVASVSDAYAGGRRGGSGKQGAARASQTAQGAGRATTTQASNNNSFMIVSGSANSNVKFY